MRRLSLCMWTILAVLVLAGPGIGQQGAAPERSSWWPRWLTTWRRPQPAQQQAPPPPQPAVALMQMNPKAAASFRRAEEENWLRRVGVCDKLRQLALQTGDNELLRKADYLDQRAWETYQKRTGQNALSPTVAVQADLDYLEQYRRQQETEPNFASRPDEGRVRANLEEEP